MGRAIVNYAGRTVGFVPAPTKVYNLAHSNGKVRFSADEIQAVDPLRYPTSTGTNVPWMTQYVTVYLTNGHKFDVKAEYEEELLEYVEKV